MNLDKSLLSPQEVIDYTHFLQQTLGSGTDRSRILASIPRPKQPSYGPLSALSSILSKLSGDWPVFELQQTHNELWKLLPEEAKANCARPEAQQLIDRVSSQCKSSYASLIDLFPTTQTAAIVDPESNFSLTHQGLADIVRNFRLPLGNFQTRPVVAISLPNGPLLALTVLATASYFTAALVAHGSNVAAEQFKADVLQSKSSVVLAPASDVQRLRLRDAWLAKARIKVLLVELSADMRLEIRCLDGQPPSDTIKQKAPNTADDIGILLFTSGTSGTKKLVPLHVHSIVCGAAMVIDSWGLNPSMRCLNQMPLHHVGGLLRNLFAPILSNGSMVACSAFDAGLFWDCVEDYSPTWYYASPSMHQCILEAGDSRPESIAKSNIRLVCNAAGDLLPSLAVKIRDRFSNAKQECTVLPSYGMTECMPISTPPLDYRLGKTGTSGVSVGPEIRILDGNDKPAPCDTVGRISVRGSPVFRGYLKENDVIDNSCFDEAGLFDTGDMGYLDKNGYLYITGRSKEVINRGGEIISPSEIEEAVLKAAQKPGSSIEGLVTKALAFSVPHDVLQEVVGIVVQTPGGSRRASLRDIQDSLNPLLDKVKVPVLVVYMDGGLPINNNKVLRIRLAERLRLQEMSDQTPQSERHHEAICPPLNTPLSVSIECSPVNVSQRCLEVACHRILAPQLDALVRTDVTGFYLELILAPNTICDVMLDVTLENLIQKLSETLHGYNTPQKIHLLPAPFPRKSSGVVDEFAVDSMLSSKSKGAPSRDMSGTEAKIANIFTDILSLSKEDVKIKSDFFDLGGDSMKAGRLLAALRKDLQVRLPINVLFTNSDVASLAARVDEKVVTSALPKAAHDKNDVQIPESLPACEETHSSSNLLLLLLQLLPIGIFYPMKRALSWVIFMYCLQFSQRLSTNNNIPGRLLNLVVSLAIGRIITKTVTPMMAVAFKWMVIGRYEEGLYPMWGVYHTRWWITQKVISIGGMGVYDMFEWTRAIYFRCLGASIGKNVRIAKGAKLGEYDLITIEDEVVLERCTVRPFAAEQNTSMYLGRITIAKNASIGLGSFVAAGTSIPRAACIGPNSSSWEAADADEANRDLAASQIPETHWLLELFLELPIQIVCFFVGLLPWLLSLVALVNHAPVQDVTDMLRAVIIWFASNNRVAFHYMALSAHAALAPAFFFFAVLVVKKTFDALCGGPVAPSSTDGRSQMSTFRAQLIRTLLPAPRLQKLTELFGTHYEMTSRIYRLMGAKVGQGVYWPGMGPLLQDYDLIDIGNDVIFGSWPHLVTSDGTGSNFVRVGDGAMVADRVVLLPGVEVGEKAVLGSGALAKRDGQYPAETTWVGSQKNSAVCLTRDVSSGIEKIELASGQTTSRTPETPNFLSLSGNSSSTILKRGKNVSETLSMADVEKNPETHFPFQDRSAESFKRSWMSEPRATHRTSLSPFSRAFYHGLAPYRVWNQATIFIYCTFVTVLTAVYWNIGSISAIQVVAHLFKLRLPVLNYTWYRPFILYALFTAIIVCIMALQSIIALAVAISAKWIVMGRRRQGNYDWDK
ncbi:MAG: putative NRPS-like protein biosynthetic cluster [Chrysothrix sp. TS-e1954]|nr:MAG: putative NRPS-like protein biosynthetic cluster [Chrysothrix sp. TS-e1954]